MITNLTKHVFAKDQIYNLIESGTLDPSTCYHISRIQNVESSSPGCEECTKLGQEWVNIRICLTCGHVGCCDTSPNQHSLQHYHETGHPIIQSFNPGESWIYCYPDDLILSS